MSQIDWRARPLKTSHFTWIQSARSAGARRPTARFATSGADELDEPGGTHFCWRGRRSPPRCLLVRLCSYRHRCRGRRRREALSDLLRLPAANPMMKVMRGEERCCAISPQQAVAITVQPNNARPTSGLSLRHANGVVMRGHVLRLPATVHRTACLGA